MPATVPCAHCIRSFGHESCAEEREAPSNAEIDPNTASSRGAAGHGAIQRALPVP